MRTVLTLFSFALTALILWFLALAAWGVLTAFGVT